MSLKNRISNVNKGKSALSATVVDVLGKYCSVRLSSNGSKITRLIYVGAAPSVGDEVVVNYLNDQPRVETIKDIVPGILSTTNEYVSSATVSGSSTQPPPPPDVGSSDHNDLPGLQGGRQVSESAPAEMFHLSSETYAGVISGCNKRSLTSNIVLNDGCSLVVSCYYNIGDNTIELLGDATLEVI